MKYFEYIRLDLDFGDLEELNRLGMAGWEVCGIIHRSGQRHHALLKRERDAMLKHLGGAA